MQELRHIGSIKDLRPQNKNNKKMKYSSNKIRFDVILEFPKLDPKYI